jgi:hypothetical protein
MGNPTVQVREETIRKKAHELWEKKGRRPGQALEDWLEAEKIIENELKAERAGKKKQEEDREVPIVILDGDTPPKIKNRARRV